MRVINGISLKANFLNLDNQFDIPDRTFHSVATTWKLSSFISTTDVKELIPEFFFLQEFLQNSERMFYCIILLPRTLQVIYFCLA